MSDPFGAPPQDMIGDDYKVPDEKDDPYRPIGSYTEDGKLREGSINKISVPGKCVALTPKTGPSGPMLVFSYVCTEGEFAGREFESYVSFSPKARFKVVETYKAHNLPLDKPYPKSAVVGTYCILNLQDEEYQGRWSAKIKSVSPHPKGAGFRGGAALPA